jgi:hypothetical protein
LARGKNDLIPIKEGGAGLARGKNDLIPIKEGWGRVGERQK